jgi:streptogramin lyase
MSRATPLVLLFVASQSACSGAIEARQPDLDARSSGCCAVVEATSASGTGEVFAANVKGCDATPPATSCLAYQGSADVYLCAAGVAAGAFVPSADGSVEFCF